VRDNRFCEFDLLTPGWKPIWDFFPLVQPGERLQRLWANLKSDLDSYAEHRIRNSNEVESFPDERQELEEYIKTHGTPDMAIYTKGYSDTTSRTLDELWEEVRSINACSFAIDICGDKYLGTDGFSYTVSRLLGQRGENYSTVDFNKLAGC
jgi:hypothetical protein